MKKTLVGNPTQKNYPFHKSKKVKRFSYYFVIEKVYLEVNTLYLFIADCSAYLAYIIKSPL